ncbi:MAG: VWA domain-containing protein [Cyanobacteria bacterium P01_G01_bin.54]
MYDSELPLWHLFNRLQAAGLPLGIGEYQAVLQALRGGFGLADRAALRRLCATVWVNSPQEREILDFHFGQIFLPPVKKGEGGKGKGESRPQQHWSRPAIALLLTVTLGTAIAQVLARIQPETPLPQPEPTPELPEPTPTPGGPAVLPPEPQPESNRLPWFIGAGLLGLTTAIAFWQWQRRRRNVPVQSPNSPTRLTQILLHNTDEIQVAQAMQQQQAPTSAQRRFFSQAYFPVTHRQMKQSWRYLRRFQRQGRKTELDLAATVQRIGQQGLLLEPVLRSPRVNHTELLLLLDTDGSMVPFGRLAQNLAETAQTAGRLRRTTVYYFHNCPGAFLYRDRYHLEGVPLPQVLANHDPRPTVVLIFSDAGAARRGMNPTRIQQTQLFLQSCQARFGQVVWVNPLPESHWSETTAAEIAAQVPMFGLSRQGFQGAIDRLRGRS